MWRLPEGLLSSTIVALIIDRPYRNIPDMLRRSMESSVITVHKKDKAAVLSAMRTAYYLAKKNRPNATLTTCCLFRDYRLVLGRSKFIADISFIITTDKYI